MSPKVAGKHYPYTAKGKQAAKAAAKRMGEPMPMHDEKSMPMKKMMGRKGGK